MAPWPVDGAPTEKSTEPPIGWPSDEITRQLSTWVPWRSRAVHRLPLGQQPERRCRFGFLPMPCTGAGRDLDPAMDALLALLHCREIECPPGLEVVRNDPQEHELVVIGFRQITARPGNLG